MTSSQQLSKVRRIRPRTVWPDEAKNFTPWLEKNIVELSGALGISLRAMGTEVSAGTRSIDILATDTDTGRSVIIENQFGKSDRDHLSRLLIYASYKDADVIIWIAEEFDDEHWRTLKWLNRRTESRTRFFGVAVEVLSIDGSPPAPHFRVIVAPEDWRLGKPRRTSRREYPEFWQGLDQKLKQNGLCVEYNEEDYTNAWFTVDFTDGLRYVFDSRDGFSLALQLDTRGSERSLQWCPAFDLLEQHKECIEKQVGGTFVWDRKWQSDWGSQIISHCPLAYYDLIESSEELHEWAVKQYSRFRDVFDNYRTELKNLKLD